jgi:hypothetical protein
VDKNMKNRFTPFFVSALSVGAVALVCQNAQAQTDLYDNTTTTYSGANFNFDSGLPGTASAGNEVVLTGVGATAYTVSQFAVQIDFTGTGTPTGSVDVQFLQNDGVAFNGYNSPSTVLWDAGSTALTSFSTGGGEVLTYTVPNISVPQDFTYVVSFSGLSATEVAGLSIYGTATVGQDHNDAWVNTAGSWSLVQAGAGEPSPQFGAQIKGTVVPEPSTIALGLMGACGFLARRRKN